MTTKQLSDGAGVNVGQSTTDTIGFFGVTPVAQPAATAQGLITDASGGVAANTNGILTLTGTYNSTILANAIATLAAGITANRAAMVSLGLIKGSN